jgi:PAS domain S-box-containing protein
MRRSDLQDRVLIMAPVGQDAAAMANLLNEHGFTPQICESPVECAGQIGVGAGALLLTEEVLESPNISVLLETLHAQPPWSELPLILLTSGGESRLTKLLDLAATAARSVTFLERPMRAATLWRSVEVALRSRRRQYQVRDLIEEQQRRQLEIERADAALRKTRDFDEAIMQNMGEGLYTVDAQGLVTSMNPAAEKLFGWTFEELRGRKMHDLTHSKHPDGSPFPSEECAGLQVLRNGATLSNHEDVFLRKDGTFFDVLYSSSPLREAGQITGLVVVFRDVTIQKREAELRNRLAAIVEFSDDAIVSKNLDSIITSWNRGAERIFGYTAQEAVGQHITILIPPDRIDEETGILGRIRRGEPVDHFETIRRRKDGTLLDVSLNISPIYDAAGRIIGASKIARDVTHRKQSQRALLESEERYRTLVSQVKDYAIFRTDTASRATSWNEGVERVLGYTEKEFIGIDITSAIFVPEDLKAGVHILEIETATVMGTANNDRWLRRKDGTRFYASGMTTALKDESGRLIGFTKVLRDDTQKKEAAEHLERTVAERTAELRATNEQLEAFVYSIAHDLRAPVRSMTGYSQMLVDDYASALDETGQHMLKRIQSSSEFMDKLLVDLLAYGRTARAELELIPVEVQKAWDTALLQCAIQIEQTNALVETVKPLPVVLAHESTFAQILANLLGNSLKFVPAGVKPHVRFSSEDRFDAIRLWLEDNGIGIPEHQHDRVFRVFERLHGSRYVGTGIGLSIVRKGAERMNGQVGFESAPGKGTRFWIDLPKAPSSGE